MSLGVSRKPSTTLGRAAAWERRLALFFFHHSNKIALAVAFSGFLGRAWLAHATFFNPDEAWHYSAANQDSLRHAYQASLALFHPPLLVIILYFWRKLGTSDLMLRLPCVIAGAVFCWLYYKWLKSILGQQVAWVGLLLVTFLPTMISMSADLRQYPLMLTFLAGAAYYLEKAFVRSASGPMVVSVICMLLGMLSHYSGFLVATSIGIYALFRIIQGRFSRGVVAAWSAGQIAGVALAWLLYSTQIRKLLEGQGANSAQLIANWYLPEFYYHPAHDHFFPFVFRGTFGVFRFTFAWVVMGHFATLLFLAGLVLLLRQHSRAKALPASHLTALLLFCPFVVNWAAAAAGLYPYGRTRHCIFLAMFGIAGISFAIVEISKRKIGRVLAITTGIIVLCQVFGTQPWRDMLPLADRRHQQMDSAVTFLRQQVSPADLIYVDKATEFQVLRYLCGQKPIEANRSVQGFESFSCSGLRVVSSFPGDNAVLLDTFRDKWREMARAYGLKPECKIWVVEGGWNTRFGETLRGRFPEFSGLEIRAFGRYLEIFSIGGAPVVSRPD